MSAPQPHKTSITFEPDAYVILQALVAQRQPWNQSDAVNAALRFYYHHADNPELDAMTSNVAAIRKQLDELLTRSPPMLDTGVLADVLVSAIYTRLDEFIATQIPPDVTPAPLTPEITTTPPDPPKPRWSERFSKRFGKPPPEHW